MSTFTAALQDIDVTDFDDTTANDAARDEWAQAVHTVAAKAKEALPESHTRIDKAVKLVLAGAVTLLDGNKARVVSQGKNGVQYHIANGECDCEDYEYRAPAGWCKHRISRALYLRAARMIEETPVTTPAPVATPVEAPADIPAQFIVNIKGKPYVTYLGLLQMSHARGLVKLEARFISVTAELALAEATATFADGRIFTEAADATKENCAAAVRVHFPRMALVRAKARALRDALACHLCSLEEVGHDEA